MQFISRGLVLEREENKCIPTYMGNFGVGIPSWYTDVDAAKNQLKIQVYLLFKFQVVYFILLNPKIPEDKMVFVVFRNLMVKMVSI